MVKRQSDELRIRELENECYLLQKKVARLQVQQKRLKKSDLANRKQLKQANEKLLQYHAQEQLENRSKSDFLANMSHEIRTPLNIILGMANLLAETKLDVDQSQYLNSLQMTGCQLMEILNNILEFVRIESGNIAIEEEPFSLQKIIDQLEATILPLCLQKELDFRVEYGPCLVLERVGDPAKIYQILLNLINNAVKFTRAGSITLAIREEQAGEDHLTLSVIDTGSGIGQGQQKKIFDRFAKGYDSQARQQGGTGLGLSISQKLAEAMAGRLTVQSTIGKGSVFSCILPLPPVAPGDRDGLRVDSSSVLPENFPEMRILAVDDIKENVDVFRAYLKDYPVLLDSAENGLMALAQLEKDDYDIILMDIRMPVMDGLEATQKIREKERLEAGPPQVILAVTAHAFQEQKTTFIEAGFDGVLSKPFFKREFLQTLIRFNTRVSNSSSEEATGNKVLGYWLEQEKSEGIPDALKELIPDVLTTISTDVQFMQRAFAEHDYTAIYRKVHSLRGVSGMFGFQKLAFLLTELSKSIKAQNFIIARELFSVLDVYLMRLKNVD